MERIAFDEWPEYGENSVWRVAGVWREERLASGRSMERIAFGEWPEYGENSVLRVAGIWRE
jgi:hypothetical protein